MKKLYLILSLFSFFIYGCDNKKEENQKVEQLEQKVQVLEKKISQEEKEKKIIERYEDFNAKNKELFKFFLNLAREKDAILNFLLEPLEKERQFEIQKEFKKENNNTFKSSFTFKKLNSNFEITFVDIISFNDELEKEGILAKIERRYDYAKLMKTLKETKLVSIEDMGFFSIFNAVEYITFYKDGRNLNHYILTPFSRSNLDEDGYKLQFKGLEAKREYKQEELVNPLFIGNSELFFKGFSYISNDKKEIFNFEPFSINYSADKDNNLKVELNNFNTTMQDKKEAVSFNLDKYIFSTKYNNFPVSLQDLIKIYYFPTSNTKIDMQGLSFTIDDKEKGNFTLYFDRLSGGDYSIIRENDFDLVNKGNLEISRGFFKTIEAMVLAKNKDEKIPDFIKEFDFYKLYYEIELPKLDKACLYHSESFLDTFNNQQLELAISALLNSLIKNSFNVNFKLNLETSLGEIKSDMIFKTDIKDKELLDKTTNLITTIKQCAIDNSCKDKRKDFIDRLGKEFIKNFDIKIKLDIDPKLVNLVLKYDEKKEIEPLFKKYKINPNQVNFIIEIKDMKISVNNQLIEDFSATIN